MSKFPDQVLAMLDIACDLLAILLEPRLRYETNPN